MKLGIMPTTPTSLARRALFLLVAGAGIGLLPVGFGSDAKTGVFSLGPIAAYADQGSGGGDGADEPDAPDAADDPDEPDDNSGSGGGGVSGSGGGGGTDDNSGSGGDGGGGSDDGGGTDNGGGDNGDGGGGADNGGGGGVDIGNQSGSSPVIPGDDSGRNQLRNVSVHYPDGWIELILNDQYRLIDNLNRQVISRRATIEDFNRMVALGS